MTGMFTVPSNSSAGSATGSRLVPYDEKTGAVSATALALLADDDDPVLGTGDCAADVEEIALRVDLLDPEMRLRVLLGPVVAGHALALDDARRIGTRTDRARATVLRIAVGVRTTTETVALHDALETVTLRRSRDFDLITRGEDADTDRVADL